MDLRRPSRERDLRRYYDDEVGTRAARALAPERIAHRTSFIELLERESRRRIIEVGCGPGRDGVPFADAGLEYLGVDLAPAAVRHCRSLGLRAEQASVLDLPFDDASFDAAWSMSTLLHVADEDLGRAVAEIARVLRPREPASAAPGGHDAGRQRSRLTGIRAESARGRVWFAMASVRGGRPATTQPGYAALPDAQKAIAHE
jgi:SAM-dependent methyltransferase